METGRDVAHRCPNNPLITLEDLPFRAGDILNAGVVRFGGEILLLVTVESLEGQCAIYLARSANGQKFHFERRPFLSAATDGAERQYESYGIRDTRVTAFDGWYYITYLGDGEHGHTLHLARTADFQSVEKLGLIAEPDTKSGALLARKIDGRFALLSRPSQGDSIWLSYSSDLVFWGDMRVVLTPRGGYWDTSRVGSAGPPVEIDEGFLLIYYGEKHTSAGPLVRLGAAILDPADPSRVTARSNIPILSPRERYERIGDVGNVVFSSGYLLEDGVLKIYYGASDSCICLGTVSVDEVLTACRDSKREF